MRRDVAVVVGAVCVHLVATARHGVSHATVPVPVPAWQGVVAAVVLFGLPVAGAALLSRGRVRAGAGLVLVAGVVSLAFEGSLHFVVANPDNVATVVHGHDEFAATAVLTTVGDALPTVSAGWVLCQAHGGSSSSCSESTT